MMPDLLSTVIAGIIGFVAGQVVHILFLKPMQDLRTALSEVRLNLSLYASTIHTPIGRTKELSDRARNGLMKSSSDLLAGLQTATFYDQLVGIRIFRLPARADIEKGAVELRRLSTYVHQCDQDQEKVNAGVSRVEKYLRLYPLP